MQAAKQRGESRSREEVERAVQAQMRNELAGGKAGQPGKDPAQPGQAPGKQQTNLDARIDAALSGQAHLGGVPRLPPETRFNAPEYNPLAPSNPLAWGSLGKALREPRPFTPTEADIPGHDPYVSPLPREQLALVDGSNGESEWVNRAGMDLSRRR